MKHLLEQQFGTPEFFQRYLNGQFERDGRTQEVVARVYFAMGSIIMETHKGKEALVMMKNLTEVCNKYSDRLVKGL